MVLFQDGIIQSEFLYILLIGGMITGTWFFHLRIVLFRCKSIKK